MAYSKAAHLARGSLASAPVQVSYDALRFHRAVSEASRHQLLDPVDKFLATTVITFISTACMNAHFKQNQVCVSSRGDRSTFGGRMSSKAHDVILHGYPSSRTTIDLVWNFRGGCKHIRCLSICDEDETGHLPTRGDMAFSQFTSAL